MSQLDRLRHMPPWQKTVFILAFAQFVSSLGFSNVFPFLPYYVEELGTNTSLSLEFLVGLVFSGQAVMMMIAAPIWGGLADRYGRKLMVERAMFGGAIIFFLMGFVRSAEELIALRALQGLVTGVVAAINALLVATAPRNKTGSAIGILQVSRWGGIAIGPLMGGFIADTIGFRPTFSITAGLLALAGILVWRLVHEDFSPAPQLHRGRHGFWREWRHIFSTDGIPFTYAIEFLNTLSRMLFLPLVPLFVKLLLTDTGHASTFTGLVLGLSSAAGTLGAVYLGQLSDRVGYRKILIASAFTAAVMYVPQTFVTQPWQFLVLQLFTGVALGGILPALGSLLAQYTTPGEEGAVYGLDNSIVAAARAIAPMAGASIAVWVSLRGVILGTAILLFFTALLALWRLPQPKMVHSS